MISGSKEGLMDKMIAYCGLTCTECPALIASRAGDDEALAKVAEQWSTEHNAQLSADDCRCDGCLSTTGPWMSHCAECNIRACAVEKDVGTCAHCADYGCDKLTEFFGFVPDAKATLDAIHAAL
jgi:hypothetical protein